MTAQSNADARRRPGRQPKLTRENVEMIRAAHANGESFAALARTYEVHPTTIRMACFGDTWQERVPSSVVEIPENMRRIPGFSTYLAGDDGRIFSLRQSSEPREMTLGESGNSYKIFIVADADGRGKTVQVHDLVCAAWHGERPSSRHRAAHNDGNRRNNAKDNLRWVGPDEQIATGRLAGEAHCRAKLTERQVIEIRAHIAAGSRPADVARTYGIHPYTVSSIASRRLWTHLADPEEGLPVLQALPRAPRAAPRGTAHGRARLSEEQVRAIRARYSEIKNRAAVAREFSVNPTTVTRIVTGSGWTHVS